MRNMRIAESLGIEVPIVATSSFFSEKSVPCCCECLRHLHSFSGFIENVCPDDSTILQSELQEGSWRCSDCGMVFCSDCFRSGIPTHTLLCQGSDTTRGQANRSLKQLGIMHTISLPMVVRFISRLIVDGSEPLDGFPSPEGEYSYFAHHFLPETAAMREAHVLSEVVLGRAIPLATFKRVFDTFEQTNLYLEIENGTMLRDIAAGVLSDLVVAKLKQRYSEGRFSAMVDESNHLPLPVVIGSGHYRTVALLNHSCDPNIEWRSVDGTARIEFVALRVIMAGEELFISYIDQSLPFPERQAELFRLYGFTCTCTKCRSGS